MKKLILFVLLGSYCLIANAGNLSMVDVDYTNLTIAPDVKLSKLEWFVGMRNEEGSASIISFADIQAGKRLPIGLNVNRSGLVHAGIGMKNLYRGFVVYQGCDFSVEPDKSYVIKISGQIVNSESPEFQVLALACKIESKSSV